jgi:hypothetical protein
MSPSHSNRKRRCPQCKGWTPGEAYFCLHCRAVLDPEREKAKLVIIDKLKAKRAAIAAEAQLPPIKRGLRRIGRIAETIYLAIISFIAWVMFWVAG